jgi:DHA1 family bicyclomycin/chloramphenicol resistance-like MFS transporter
MAEQGSGLARAAKAPLGLVLLLGALTAFGPISIDMYLPALPAIARSLHGTATGAQLTLSAFFVGIAFGQLIYGPVSDRQGRRWPLLFGVCLYLVGTLGCLLATSIPMLIGFRVLQALGGCAGMVIARAIVRDRFAPEEVLHVFSMLMLVMGIAPILAPLIGGWVLLIGNWRWIFGVQMVFAGLMALGVFFALSESLSIESRAHARGETALRSYGALLGHPRLIGYMLAGAFSGAAMFTYVSCSPDVLIGYFHVSPQAFGWVFGANAVGLVVGTQVNARLARRLTSDTILRRANLAVLAAAGLLLIDAMTGFGGFFGVTVPLFLIIGGMGFNQANATAGALNIDPRRAGTTSSLLGASTFATGAGASAMAGILRDGTARPMAVVILAALAVAWLSLVLLVRRPRPA